MVYNDHSQPIRMKYHVYIPERYANKKIPPSDQVSSDSNWQNRPFHIILANKWLVAANNCSSVNIIDQIDDVNALNEESILIGVDHLLGNDLEIFSKTSKASTYYFSCLLADNQPSFIEGPYHPCGMNLLRMDRQGNFFNDKPWHYDYKEAVNLTRPYILEPHGCPQSWIKFTPRVQKRIFLDEPHPSLVINEKTCNSINFKSYIHALKVCEVLHEKYGFEIISFSRVKDSDYIDYAMTNHPYIQFISIGEWVSLPELLAHYSSSCYFYSWFTETHGYPLYESRQAGCIVISYSEICNTVFFKNYQDSLFGSLYMKPSDFAAIISRFNDENYNSSIVKNVISNSAQEFSSETFLTRVISSDLFRK